MCGFNTSRKLFDLYPHIALKYSIESLCIMHGGTEGDVFYFSVGLIGLTHVFPFN